MIAPETGEYQSRSPWQQDWTAAAARLRGTSRILLTTHVNPDGDGIGSMLALAEALRTAGCDVRCALPSPVPLVFRFLFADCGLVAYEADQRNELDAWRPGLLVILDVSSLERIGWVGDLARDAELPLMVLDHHLSNEMSSELVYCFPGLSSTGEVVAALLEAIEAPVSRSMAQALFTSLVTDTGGFAFASTGPETLELAGRLVRAGARPERIHEEVYLNYPESRFELQRLFLGSRKRHLDGQLLEFELSPSMFQAAGAAREEAEGFANMGLGIRGCRMTLILSELDEGGVKVNLRCKAPFDVCAIARALGGGGHRFAAGATVKAPLDDVRHQVLEMATKQIKTTGEAA